MKLRTVLLLLVLLSGLSLADETSRSKVVFLPGLWEGTYRPVAAQRVDQLLIEELGGTMSGVAQSIGRPKSDADEARMVEMAKEGGVRFLIVTRLECRRSIEPFVRERPIQERFHDSEPPASSVSIAGVGTLVIYDLGRNSRETASVLLLESQIVEQRPGTQAFELQEQNLAERLVRSFGQDILRRLEN